MARSSVKAAIMRAIIEKAGLETKAGAICFSLPVSRIEGLRRLDESLCQPRRHKGFKEVFQTIDVPFLPVDHIPEGAEFPGLRQPFLLRIPL